MITNDADYADEDLTLPEPAPGEGDEVLKKILLGEVTPEDLENGYATEEEDEYPEEDAEEDSESTQELPQSVEELEEFYIQQTTPIKVGDKEFDLSNRAEMQNILNGYVRYTRNKKEKDNDSIIAKSLQQANIDMSKVNDLIELHVSGAKGIAYYIEKYNVDVSDVLDALNEITETPYTPKRHLLDEPNYRLQETAAEVLSTPTGTEALNFVQTWDDLSKNELLKHPMILHSVNSAIADGFMNEIKDFISQGELTTRYIGFSDVQKFIDAFDVISKRYIAEETKKVSKQSLTIKNKTKTPKRPTANRASIPKTGGRLKANKGNQISEYSIEEILRMSDTEFKNKLFKG